MANVKLLACGGLTFIIGLGMAIAGALIGGVIEAIQVGAVDSMFIDAQKDSESGDCITCKEDDEDEKCTPTCEEDQIKWFTTETNPSARRRWTHQEPDKYDFWVYTVTNAEDVVDGAKPKVDYVDAMELYEIVKFDQVGELSDGKLEFKQSKKSYRLRDTSTASIAKAQEVIDTAITVPHVTYSVVTNKDNPGQEDNVVHVVLAGGVQAFLGNLAGSDTGKALPLLFANAQIKGAVEAMTGITVPAGATVTDFLRMEYQHGAVSIGLGMAPVAMGGGGLTYGDVRPGRDTGDAGHHADDDARHVDVGYPAGEARAGDDAQLGLWQVRRECRGPGGGRGREQGLPDVPHDHGWQADGGLRG